DAGLRRVAGAGGLEALPDVVGSDARRHRSGLRGAPGSGRQRLRRAPGRPESLLRAVAARAPLPGPDKYSGAGPLLMQGSGGMKRREARSPLDARGSLAEALGRVAQRHDGWGRKDKADEWRKRLEAVGPAAKPSTDP